MGLAVPEHDEPTDRSAGRKTATTTYKDYIVLLSDGLNTQNRWTTTQIRTSTPVRRSYATNIKADKTNPVTVFTIQVNINNADPISQVLQYCATDGQFPDDHERRPRLPTRSRTIRTQISKLRVSK